MARTDWDVPKHAGMSYFVLPMQQPGVENRPILQMNRHSSFNEVFLTEARIPVANLLGAPPILSSARQSLISCRFSERANGPLPESALLGLSGGRLARRGRSASSLQAKSRAGAVGCTRRSLVLAACSPNWTMTMTMT